MIGWGEQARIGTDLATRRRFGSDLDANLSEWQEIVELATSDATRCGAA